MFALISTSRYIFSLALLLLSLFLVPAFGSLASHLASIFRSLSSASRVSIPTMLMGNSGRLCSKNGKGEGGEEEEEEEEVKVEEKKRRR